MYQRYVPYRISLFQRAYNRQFGYGGTNSHCILECAPTSTAKSGFNTTRHNSSLNVGDDGPSVVEDRPHLLVFSAHDGATLKRNIDAYSKIRGEVNLTDLAYTLSTRRTKLPYRAFVVCRSFTGAVIANAVQTATQSTEPSPICFVFTGTFRLFQSLYSFAHRTL